MNDPAFETSPLRSEFSTDSDMEFLIRLFVEEVPERIDEFRQAWERSDAGELARLAHQMRGAAPGYGFTPLGDSAKAFEKALIEAAHDLSAVQQEFESLIQVCGRVSR